ncbi:uncharacterized protein BX664DRAFT_285247 [Halteromyces radiatus]|uniref:uncharacterized protein n=1 Tax=Halteromyces radiatus TaxID=101107 RepID=UPI0022205A16|nr:uncharacterized protein BX664DRAFT_285247 [Halteromyces radiatus]KAI8081317.1 hypothetical protein BX664DRAFT_285247 [Halteromyces radiatus]
MTHLSDFSFLQRMVSLAYLSVWFLYRVWKLDRFRCLHPHRFRQGELKSVVTALILVMIPFQLYYDVTSCKIKYEEGFASVFGHIFTKPEMMWTKADQELVVPTNYSLCIGLSLQTGTLLLLQCFWNYLANSVAKASFMSSREFLFYIIWTFVSIIIFPVLQYNFSREIYDPTYKEIMPELVYGFEIFFVACLGVVSHFRFRKLLNNSRDSNNARSITHKIRYFQELNLILTVVLFIDAIAFIILSADGLTGRKTLNAHKFSADFLICNINISTLIVWFLVMLIFHPKPQGSTSQGMQNPTNDFLSNGKQLDGYPGSPPMMTQASQASSDYLQYTKSVGVSINSPYPASATYQLGPLPPPPSETMHHNNSVASSTPSTATLVSSPNYQGRRSKGMTMDPTESMIDDTTHLPPYRPVGNNHTQPRSGPGAAIMEPILSEDENSQCRHCHQCQQQPTHTNDSTMHTIVNVDNDRNERYSGDALSLSHRDTTFNSMAMSHTSEEKRTSQNESMITNQLAADSDTDDTGVAPNRNPNWQLSLDFSEKATNNVKRENSDDSMWLHQSPKGVVGSG